MGTLRRDTLTEVVLIHKVDIIAEWGAVQVAITATNPGVNTADSSLGMRQPKLLNLNLKSDLIC